MLKSTTVEQLNQGRKRVDLHKAEKLTRGERYSRSNIVEEVGERGYSRDRVEHLMRYHWPWLESMSELSEDHAAVYIDLCVAVERLQGEEKQAVNLLIDGWATQGQYAPIAKQMGVKTPTVKQLLGKAFQQISETLGYPQKVIESAQQAE